MNESLKEQIFVKLDKITDLTSEINNLLCLPDDKPKTGRRVGDYYFIHDSGYVDNDYDEMLIQESYTTVEDIKIGLTPKKRWNFGNYFYTKEQAECVLKNKSPGFYSDNDNIEWGLSEYYKSWQRHFGIRGIEDE